MKQIDITVHCLVRNEENWIWYALQSVLPYVSKIFVFDTGSTDKTVEIVQSIRSSKIFFEQKKIVDRKKFTLLRQEMLDRTKTTWFMVLDGDEVWPRQTIQSLIKTVARVQRKIDVVWASAWMPKGDIFHYSNEVEQLAESLSGKKGFWLPRAIKKIKGLHCIGEYGNESYADEKNTNISNWSLKRCVYLKEKFFHLSFLPRSATRTQDLEVMMRGPKTFFVKGKPFPKYAQYPEVFMLPHPKIVPDPWRRFTWIKFVKGVCHRAQNAYQKITKKKNN